MGDAAGIEEELATVGPQLRWLRNQREVAPTERAATGTWTTRRRKAAARS